jgi:hypothetical protein
MQSTADAGIIASMPDSDDSTFTATLLYSEPLLRKVVFAFWRRTVGISFPIVLVVFAALIALAASQYGMNWYLATLAALAVLGTLLIAAIFVIHYRHTMARFRKLKEPRATLTINGDQFTVTSDLGSSTMAWRVVSEVWCFPEFWLLMFSRAQFMTLPLEGLPVEMQNHIAERVEAAGGRVA